MTTAIKEMQYKEFNPYKLAFYSSLGYWAIDMIMYPLDTISTKIKSYSKEFLSFRKGFHQVINHGGYKSLFRGFSTTFPCCFVPQLIYFSAYESLNRLGMKYINNIKSDNLQTYFKLGLPLFTASVSEILCLIPYMPFDVVRTRLQINDPNFQYRGLFQGVREISEKEGLIRLYQASPIYIATVTAQVSVFFWLYEMQRYLLLHNSNQTESNGKHKLSLAQSVMVGFNSSLFATFIVNPFDLVLTRFQMIDSNQQTLSVKSLIKGVVKNEGYIGFFKGITPRLFISCGNSILFMPIYEHFKNLYGVDLSSND
ncbi:carrier protein (macronuclear) [Tetrahymena thermophila SB210]|uniref:Carrier protein n=1 Tax=Tetrahymena thermophila (strain SB210) TaxID=312017 RepID=Q22D95_TETTS|nr:carrier protein [Tetrahymena thermophila SB210]EAR83230.2 carrier protein [Tetrahymena thermophila SB210]|eukprot:XP_001030893.2 carrier protein [Tetrahymena thermophila SB210]